MSVYIQGFSKGFIAREGNQYQYNEGGKVVGTYDSVEELVAANSKTDGEQDRPAPEAEPTTTPDVAPKSAPKSKRKPTRKVSKKES